MTPTARLLIAYAHPDDESFGLGGLIAKYVEQRVEVYLICATNGDVGTVKPELLNGYGSIAELRLAELDCAATKLKLTQVFKLGYRDSGMQGSETSNDPECLWQQPRAEVARKVVEVIREVRPQVIITFNRYGGYGHPDHIAIQRATDDAFKLAGDPAYETGQPPYTPQKLYYSGLPDRQIRLMVGWLRLRGKDPRKLGRNGDIDLQAVLDHVEPTHARVDIRRHLEQWDEANACHASQLGGGFPRLPMPVRRVLMPYQSFTRVFPPPRHGEPIETDLFQNVLYDEKTPTLTA